MASNTSSMFNDGPAEAAPPASTQVEVTPAPTSVSSAPTSNASALPTSTDVRTPTTGPITPTPTSSPAPIKQLAPRMEPTLDDHAAPNDAKLPSLRFSRVGGVGLEDMKSTLTFRKSCLKRSSEPSAPLAIPTPAAPTESLPTQKNRRRCWECRAKVPLTAVTCRCGYTFCTKHRYAEEHHCRYNFKQAAKRKLEDENPRCVPAKVARIN